jgi:hypothetical protein
MQLSIIVLSSATYLNSIKSKSAFAANQQVGFRQFPKKKRMCTELRLSAVTMIAQRVWMARSQMNRTTRNYSTTASGKTVSVKEPLTQLRP